MFINYNNIETNVINCLFGLLFCCLVGIFC
nr:MAG TPA: hypothetical protein [Caudoviricetes sp.]